MCLTWRLVHVLNLGGWFMYLEAGARGFVARSTYSFLRKIGFTAIAARTICQQHGRVRNMGVAKPHINVQLRVVAGIGVYQSQ